MDISEIFKNAIISHRLDSTYWETKIDFDNGHTVKIYVIPVHIVDLSAPHVELLTADSTPQRLLEDETAKPKLEKAISDLVEKGTVFYTYFRANWALPAYLWRIKK